MKAIREHPAGLGGSDVFAQASILDMYDPDRAQIITYLGEIRTWSDYALSAEGSAEFAEGGEGQRSAHPERGHQFADHGVADGAGKDGVSRSRSGSSGSRSTAITCAPDRMLAFGQYVETRYNLDKADIILSLDGDFLSSGFPGFLYYARQFAARRNPDLKEKMSRFYSIQSTPTNTSGKADHRLPVRASEVEAAGARDCRGRGRGWRIGANVKPEHQKFVAAVVKDLQAHKGAAVVIPGDNQPPAVHALAHAMNQRAGRERQHRRLHRDRCR